MSPSDWISSAALVVSILAAHIAFKALRETRRSNQIALLDRRTEIYDGFKRLAEAALCQGPNLHEEEVTRFAEHAAAAERYLPRTLADEIAQFFEDCEKIVWVRSLQQPVDREYVQRAEASRQRVHRTALATQEKLLQVVRAAADA